MPLVSEIKEKVETRLSCQRRRLFTPWRTLKLFLHQSLSSDGSCRETLKQEKLTRDIEMSENNAAYCNARKRLPEQALKTLMKEAGQTVNDQLEASQKFYGYQIKLIDGSTFSMADSAANQQAYPQPGSQAKGAGFPMARVVAVIGLATGALLDLAIGKYSGKQTGEHALFRQLIHHFGPGDLAMGDRYYPSYWLLHQIMAQGAQGVFEQHAARKSDFRRGKHLGKGDHIVTWDKPEKPNWMNQQEYEKIPDKLTIREIKSGDKILVTTLLDAKKIPAKAIKKLYYSRWHVEVDLRAIKTTMQMEQLRCKSPEMVRKELWVGLLAYNIIRSVMLEAANRSQREPRTISFKGCLQTLNAITQKIGHLANDLYEKIILSVASSLVGNRPNRKEPRAIKKRPKAYPRLQKPRREYA